ncbi:MAG: hypothetical protein K2X53_04370, partial [Alphaproteobacteria bacterium]|nr:hypothetical protein [Alphaproteobacteria bacterium]
QRSQDFSLHMLLCNRDLEMGICAAKSFQLANQRSFVFTFHEDGSLSREQILLIEKHFPSSRIIRRKEADQELEKKYSGYHSLLQWRASFVLALKIVDVFHYATSPRIIFVDSDVLFFDSSEELLKSPCNVFNKDIESSYFATAEEMQDAWGVKVIPCINSGLWNIERSLIDLAWVNDVVGSSSFSLFSANRRHVSEQTIMALLASKKKDTTLLSSAYDVSYFKKVSDSVCKHYVGRIRHGFEMEGLLYLLKEKSFQERWNIMLTNVAK